MGEGVFGWIYCRLTANFFVKFLPAWVSSRYCSFLTQSKDRLIKLTGYSKYLTPYLHTHVGENVQKLDKLQGKPTQDVKCVGPP